MSSIPDEKQAVTDGGEAQDIPVRRGTTRNASVVPKELLHGAGSEDEAMKAFAEAGGVSLEIDEVTNKRLKRKIDMNLLPIMCIVYGLNYLDKTTLSYANVMGLKDDIGLVGDQYQWLGSMFYFGYLVWEYPTNRLLQRLPLGKYSAFNVFMWGAVLCCMAAVQNFSGALAVRFFLGMFEAAVTPGAPFRTPTRSWYTKSEQAFRIGFWFSFNGWAQIVGGFVAYGIAVGARKNDVAIDGWRIVFLWTGLLTASLGVVFWFVVPDNQLNARFLNQGDRVRAVERIRVNQQGVGNRTFKAYQLKEALTDPLVWFIFLYALVGDIPNGGISNFFSVLITSFGYTAEESLLYGTPGGAVEVITIVGWAIATHYHPQRRIIYSSLSLLIGITGIILIIAVPNSSPRGRLTGYYFTQASSTPFVALLSLIGTNIAGYTKKTTAAAMYLIGYCVGNIIGPQVFQPADAPQYVPAEVTFLVCWAVCFADLWVIYGYLRWMNGKRERARRAEGYTRLENQEFLDLTDHENLEFVYTT